MYKFPIFLKHKPGFMVKTYQQIISRGIFANCIVEYKLKSESSPITLFFSTHGESGIFGT